MKTEGKKQSQEAEKDENSPPSPMRFDKLLVSISGGTKRRKEELAGLIKAKGGRYTGEMSKGCTHLVVLDKPSDTRKASAKETHGRQWKIPVVTADWVVAVAKLDQLQAIEDKYMMPEPPRRARVSQPSPKRPTLLEKPAAATTEATKMQAQVLPIDSTTRQPEPAVPPETAERSVPSQAAQQSGEAADANRKPVPQPTSPGKPEPREPTADDVENDDRCEPPNLWLSGTYVHLVGMSTLELRRARYICNKGAAKKSNSMKDRTTHIIAGSEVTPAEAEEVRKHVRDADPCELTSLAWLEECLSHERLLPVGKHAVRPAALAAQAGGRQQSTLKAGKQHPPKVPVEKLMLGKWFTVVALSDSKDRWYSQHKIQLRGGTLFDARSCNLVSDWKEVYAICPLSLSTREIRDLQARSADFAKVPEQNRLSVRWLDVCEDRNELLLPVPTDYIECRPLRLNEPEKILSHVFLTTSNLDTMEDNRLRLLTRILGGRSSNVLSHKTTHLLVKHAAGKKYETAVHFNIKIITPDWLIHVALTGQIRDEGEYRPPAHPGTGNFVEPSQLAMPHGPGKHTAPDRRGNLNGASRARKRPVPDGGLNPLPNGTEHPPKRSRLQELEKEMQTPPGPKQRKVNEPSLRLNTKLAAEGTKGQHRAKKRALLDRFDEATILPRKAQKPRIEQSNGAEVTCSTLHPGLEQSREVRSPALPPESADDDGADLALSDQVEECVDILRLIPEPAVRKPQEPAQMGPPPARGVRKPRIALPTPTPEFSEPQLDCSQQVSYEALAEDSRPGRGPARTRKVTAMHGCDTASIKMRLANLAGADKV